jgi:hypothetical protein
MPEGLTVPQAIRWLEELTDPDFDRVCCAAIMSVVCDDMDRRVNPVQLGALLGLMRRRYRRIAFNHLAFSPGCHVRGDKVHTAKLSEFAARVIRRLPRSITHREVARAFRLGDSNIRRLRLGAAWRHLGPPSPFPDRRVGG